MSNDLTPNISLGFLSPPSNPSGFPGLEGGIRVSVGDRVLTKREWSHSREKRLYDSEGNRLDNDSGEYPGWWLDWNLEALSDAILRFQRNEYDRYEQLSAKMEADPGFTTIVMSFCDGEHVRIAYQPVSADDGRDIPVESTVGYAVDPDELCRELVECYRECTTYVENAYTDWDYGDLSEDIEIIQDWADEHIQKLLAAISEDD